MNEDEALNIERAVKWVLLMYLLFGFQSKYIQLNFNFWKVENGK